jgi:hypothetical protein
MTKYNLEDYDVVYLARLYHKEDGNFIDELKNVQLAEGGITPPDPPPVSSDGRWISFNPLWRVGASGGLYADPGDGYIQGWYKQTPAKLVLSGSEVTVIETEVFIELDSINPFIPSGEGFEFELPSLITPDNPRTGRGSGGDLWLEGGANHYSVSAKWTDRSNRPMRVIIVLGNGQEWTTNVPKVFSRGSLFVWMKYLA